PGVRSPEKFASGLTGALVVLVAAFIDRLTPKWRIAWGVITFVPLAVCVVRGAPIDWFAPYRVPAMPPLRVCGSQPINWGTRPARAEYRDGVKTMPAIFGAVSGLRYATHRWAECMHSLMRRIVVVRVAATPPQT